MKRVSCDVWASRDFVVPAGTVMVRSASPVPGRYTPFDPNRPPTALARVSLTLPLSTWSTDTGKPWPGTRSCAYERLLAILTLTWSPATASAQPRTKWTKFPAGTVIPVPAVDLGTRVNVTPAGGGLAQVGGEARIPTAWRPLV